MQLFGFYAFGSRAQPDKVARQNRQVSALHRLRTPPDRQRLDHNVRQLRLERARSTSLQPVALLANLAVERDRSNIGLDSELLLESFGTNTELPQRRGVPALLAKELHQTAMHALTQRIQQEQARGDGDGRFDGI